MLNTLINLSRRNKKIVMLLVDAIAIIVAILAAFSMRLGSWYWPDSDLIWAVFGAPIIAIPIFVRFGLYRAIIRFIGFKALWAIVQAVALYALLWGVIGFMASFDGIPRSVVLINWLLAVMAIGGSRMIGRWILSEAESREGALECQNVVVYGAGSAGRQLSIALTQSNEYNPIAFIDDNSEMHRQSINGIEIISRNDLELLVKQKNVTEVLLAIPTMSSSRRNEIIHYLEPYPVRVRSLPSVSELAQGKVKLADLREVSVKDLLGRESVIANKDLLSLNIVNKVVMVTGAGGSIGAELCRQILFIKPKMLILFEQNEFALYNIERELSDVGMPYVEILPILGSVNNSNRLNHVMQRFAVQTIYHAAAYKHVPMVEFNNAEGVENNIFGTLNCAQVAINKGVETFVLISTDKAVRPTNTMGATKRFAEMVLQALAFNQLEGQDNESVKGGVERAVTRFSMVRFGNVLDSSGSVVPLFKEQIKQGGPVTVTDSEILRYFMTIPEAVELVIQAGSMGQGGDVFVLDMGEPVRIVDLAKKMIRLSGLEVRDEYNPDGDIEIKFTGLRPGEKLYEELLIGDNVSDTDNPLIMRAQEKMLAWDEIRVIIDDLSKAIDSCDQEKLRQLLTKAVPEFKPQCEISDILYDG